MSPPLLLSQRLAFAAGKTAVRRAVSTPALQPLFPAAPVVLHSCKQRPRPKAQPNSNTTQQESRAPQQQVQPHQQQPRRGLFRRLRVLCACTVRALPAAGIKAAVLSGVQHLSSVTTFAGLSGAVVAGLALGVAGKATRRWHAGRRAARRAMVSTAAGAGATDVTILTFNIRGVMDRWPERAPVLRQVLKQADADIVCFQEVLTGEFRQEQLLLGSNYQVHECRAALQHLRNSSILGAAVSSVLSALLGVSWLRSLLVSLPESVETWRERNRLAGGWARLLRDITMVPFYGNSIATRLPATTVTGSRTSSSSHSSSCSTCWPAFLGGSSSSGSGSSGSSSAVSPDILVLGDFRAAQRVCLKLKLSPQAPQQQQQQQQGVSREELHELIQQQMQGFDSITEQQQQQGQQQRQVLDVWLVNTHLDHASPEIRARQMQAICQWMEPLKATAGAIVITGDLNAPPDEELHDVAAVSGFASTHKVAHGSEPAFTWPSGIVAPLMDEGDPHCADYIYVWQAAGYELQVLNAQLWGDKPTASDTTLYPSDHLGLKVTLRITPRSGSGSSGGGGVSGSGAVEKGTELRSSSGDKEGVSGGPSSIDKVTP